MKATNPVGRSIKGSVGGFASISPPNPCDPTSTAHECGRGTDTAYRYPGIGRYRIVHARTVGAPAHYPSNEMERACRRNSDTPRALMREIVSAIRGRTVRRSISPHRHRYRRSCAAGTLPRRSLLRRIPSDRPVSWPSHGRPPMRSSRCPDAGRGTRATRRKADQETSVTQAEEVIDIINYQK